MKGVRIMAYTDYPDNIMDEILGGANGPKENEAEKAVNFLTEWTKYITDFIELIKNFFNELSAMLSK